MKYIFIHILHSNIIFQGILYEQLKWYMEVDMSVRGQNVSITDDRIEVKFNRRFLFFLHPEWVWWKFYTE